MLVTAIRASKINLLALSVLLLILHTVLTNAQTTPTPAPRIYAQKLVEETLPPTRNLWASNSLPLRRARPSA